MGKEYNRETWERDLCIEAFQTLIPLNPLILERQLFLIIKDRAYSPPLLEDYKKTSNKAL